MKILRRLAFFGSSNHIDDTESRNFLGIIELLSKYDPLLSHHVGKVRKSQLSHKRLQVHYLSTRLQNEFIDLCDSFVQTAIINEIHITKYFSNIIDATPDCSHQEQTTFIIRYLNVVDGSKMSIEERFHLFDIHKFTKKSGKGIASFVLKKFKRLTLEFQNFIGQANDNDANMAGTYKCVKAVLQEVNSSCLFSPYRNHTLNLEGCDCAESCKEAITYFGTIQEMYNYCSSSPQR